MALRQHEGGAQVAEIIWKLAVTEQKFHRCKQKFAGLRMDQAKRLKELEKDNARLKRMLADADLDKAILKEVASGNF
ncbi:MAG: hypothetical protein C0485_10810 [Pirellula sp.]|nr:hypothetical protein [Pirellula sp.]